MENTSMKLRYNPELDPQAIYWTTLCGNATLYNAFWSPELTVNTPSPDLSHCFQDTVLVWVPCVLLLLCSLPYFYYLRNLSYNVSRGRSLHNRATIGLGALLAVLCLIRAVLTISSSQGDDIFSTPAAIISQFLLCISAIVATIISSMEYRRGFHTSAILCPFWLITCIFNIVPFRSLIIQSSSSEIDVLLWNQITFYMTFALIFLLACLSCLADTSVFETKFKEGYEETVPLLGNSSYHVPYKKGNPGDQAPDSPYMRATFLSRITFAWITKFLVQGYRRPIEFKHLHRLLKSDTTESLVATFESYFTSSTKQGQKNVAFYDRPTWHLFKSLVLANKTELLTAAVCRLIAIGVVFLNPQILRLLIGFVGDKEAYLWHGVVFSICLLLVTLSFSVTIHWWVYFGYHVGQRVRTVVNSIIYKKAIRLSSVAKRTTTVGEIVNLMSVDAQKLQDVPQLFTIFWSFPIMTALSLYFLYETVGVSAFAGLVVLALLLPFNAFYLGNKIRAYQENQMVLKDDRIRVMSEILSGIKVLKFYAWEPSFQKKASDIRDKELLYLKWAAYCNGIGSITWFLSPYLVSLVIFAVYVNIGENNVLDAEKAFVSMSLINILNFPIALLPLAVSYVGQGYVSLKRISRFLTLDEIEQTDATGNDDYQMEPDDALVLKNATFSWGNEHPVLHRLNVTVKQGQLVAVVGHVGAGKSSLMSSVLGEMKNHEGTAKLNGKVAYVPQQAWIQNATLKDNILFGKPMVEPVYKSILEACALLPDLKILPGGDLTEIGEKGINLSGGQKQRVSLARAVYQDAEIYLLDDPLSAVDAHVGQHIFNKVIGPDGILKNKTRVLNTHGIGYLPQVDSVVVMTHGHIYEMGTYQQLLNNRGAFAEFLQNYSKDQTSKENAENTDENLGEEDVEIMDYSSVHSHSTNKSPTRRQHKQSLRTSVSRRISTQTSSVMELEVNEPPEKSELISEETAETGGIGAGVISAYIKAGSLLAFVSVCLSHLGFIAAQCLTNIWLSEWTNDPIVNGTRPDSQTDYRLGVYGGLGVMQASVVAIEAVAVALGCIRASRVLHTTVLDRILHAPMSFFDTTPLGRILNRFSKDLDIVDANLPLYIRFWLFDIAPLVSTIVIISYSTPIFLVAVVALSGFYFWIQRVVVTNINQLKRLDAVKRSPIYAHFDETIVGLTSIRAYQKEKEFIKKTDQLIDHSQRAWFLYSVVSRWVGIWVEALGSFLVFLASLLAVLQRDSLSAGMAGLSISYSLQLTLFLNITIRSAAELETYVVSVERIKEYSEVPQEAAWSIPEKKPSHSWPSEGSVELYNYSTRYRPGLDLVLKGVSCHIKPTERVGIVGRTGAGKSSLTLSLFRILEAAGGDIRIDGVNIADIGLHDLRSRLTIIPQDPVLFSGSLRSNLDPFNKYLEGDIWKALEHSHLKKFASALQEGLEYEVGENGEALSVGQRQLVCLARALLHKTKILILDEATAAVDMETDDLIQTTIRTQFTDSTIITIAHRLNTVLDYDRIMVLDQGKIDAFDSPRNLLQNDKSIFSVMAKDAGISNLIQPTKDKEE